MSVLKMLERYVGMCAAKTLRQEHPLVIAVTGSIGKSSTKEMIGAMLAGTDRQLSIRVSAKNYNNELGVPLTVFDLPAPGRSLARWIRLGLRAQLTAWGWRTTGVQIFVLEMGADKPGDLAYLTRLAPPDIAVMTAINAADTSLKPVHLARYPSLAALIEEKATLVRALKPGGTAILNADDPAVSGMRHLTAEHRLTFGESDGADVRLLECSVLTDASPHGQIPTGLSMVFESLGRRRRLILPGVFGRSMAYAVCAALAVSAALDLGLEAIERLPENVAALPGRTRILPGIRHTILYDDTYNASPASVLSALHDLAHTPLDPGQRRAACIGEMRELGEAAEAMHARIGRAAAELGLDLFVPCGTMARVMAESARAYGLPEDRVQPFEDTPEAGRFIETWIKPGDVVLAKSSQGSIHGPGVRLERIIKRLMAEPERATQLLVRQEPEWNRI